MKKLKKLNRQGQSLMEYTVLIAVVSMVGLAAATGLGREIKGKIKDMRDKLGAVKIKSLVKED
jgi:Flp pilus assembly pilin Flp